MARQAGYYRFSRRNQPRLNTVSSGIMKLTIGVTVLQFLSPSLFGSQIIRDQFALYLPRLWQGDFWRLLSVTLVHDNAFHIFMNMYALWLFGRLFEPLVGGKRFLLIYVLSGLGGSIAVALFGQIGTPVVGASGAIYGIFGGLLAYYYGRYQSLGLLWKDPLSRQLIILLGINIVISFAPGISLLGHLGGLIVGSLIGYLFGRHDTVGLAFGEKAGSVILGFAMLGILVYSAMPVHRGGFWLIKSVNLLGYTVDAEGNFIWHQQEEGFKQERLQEARAAFEKSENDPDNSKLYRDLRDHVGGLIEKLERAFQLEEISPPPQKKELEV